jgi:hypothetical protein
MFQEDGEWGPPPGYIDPEVPGATQSVVLADQPVVESTSEGEVANAGENEFEHDEGG